MRELVVAVFPSEPLASEALGFLRRMGYRRQDLALLSGPPLQDNTLQAIATCSRAVRLMEMLEATVRWGFRWAIAGSIVVEIPVLVWLLATDHGLWMRVFLGITLWKMGAVLGLMLGAVAGQEHGLEADVARHYEGVLARDKLVLASRVRYADLLQVRGLLIESGAQDVRAIDGGSRLSG